MLRTRARDTVKELAYRATDGLEVALLWHESASFVTVAVSDSKTSISFELVLGSDDNALDVFHHPYAYAASRRLDVGPNADRCRTGHHGAHTYARQALPGHSGS